jgi:phospholysine phosphohistidine inorganic pyrophosphate phosphatase
MERGNAGANLVGARSFAPLPILPYSPIPLPAYLFDLDGTLYQGDAAIPGAPELIARLRREGTPFRFVTNTTSKPRSSIVTRLRSYGFVLDEEEVFTALLAGGEMARELGCATLLPLVTPAASPDLEGFELVGGCGGMPGALTTAVDAVIVGDLGPLWSFELIQQAFTALMNDARLIALSRDRYWMSTSGLTIDCGAFVTALEYASGREAILAGKPSPAFYHAAIKSMGLLPGTSEVVMVGDDILSDVGGAQSAGCQGYLVRTGKFREETLASSGVNPDRMLGSIAELLDSESGSVW